jgi:hypothetical protein
MGYLTTNGITQTTPTCLRNCFWGIIFEIILFRIVSQKSSKKSLKILKIFNIVSCKGLCKRFPEIFHFQKF